MTTFRFRTFIPITTIPGFLKEYFGKFGEKPILIADHVPNVLKGKMPAHGLRESVVSSALIIGDTQLQVLPHRTGAMSDVDSALIVKYFDGNRTHWVVNSNDIVFDESFAKRLKEESGEIDILFCGYTGAGPYPQTYFDPGDPLLPLRAEEKKAAFFERNRFLTDIMDARINVPFAGKYVLGGRLVDLNAYRGVADPVEVLCFDRRAHVLVDQGGCVSSNEEKPASDQTRTIGYSENKFQSRVEELRGFRMHARPSTTYGQ